MGKKVVDKRGEEKNFSSFGDIHHGRCRDCFIFTDVYLLSFLGHCLVMKRPRWD